VVLAKVLQHLVGHKVHSMDHEVTLHRYERPQRIKTVEQQANALLSAKEAKKMFTFVNKNVYI
jgi:hypothetical protein